jgi:hypothetical protein
MKKLLPWLIIGLVLRLALIPLTLHPDFRAVNLAAYWIAQKGEIFTFYDHISKLPRTDHLVLLYGDNLFIYPPLAYLTHAVFDKVLYWAYPQNTFWLLINDIGRLRRDPGFPLLMYFLKLPYLIADFACLWVILKLLPEKTRTAGALFWIFNPVTIYVSYMIGQFDIFIALFLLLTLLYADKKPWLAAVFLGLSACFKPFTLVLAPLLPGSKLKNLLISGGTYLLTILPYLRSPAFKQYALLASQSDKLFYAKIIVSGSQYVPVFVLGLFLIYWWNYFRPKTHETWGWLVMPLLLFYSVTNYHPQWFVWVIPFLMFLWINISRSRLPVIILLKCYFVIVLLFEISLNFGLFGLDFSFSGFITRFIAPDLLASIIRGVFAGVALGLVLMSATHESKTV